MEIYFEWHTFKASDFAIVKMRVTKHITGLTKCIEWMGLLLIIITYRCKFVQVINLTYVIEI